MKAESNPSMQLHASSPPAIHSIGTPRTLNPHDGGPVKSAPTPPPPTLSRTFSPPCPPYPHSVAKPQKVQPRALGVDPKGHRNKRCLTPLVAFTGRQIDLTHVLP